MFKKLFSDKNNSYEIYDNSKAHEDAQVSSSCGTVRPVWLPQDNRVQGLLGSKPVVNIGWSDGWTDSRTDGRTGKAKDSGYGMKDKTERFGAKATDAIDKFFSEYDQTQGATDKWGATHGLEALPDKEGTAPKKPASIMTLEESVVGENPTLMISKPLNTCPKRALLPTKTPE